MAFEARGDCLLSWYWWHLRREVIVWFVDIGGIWGERWLLDLLILVAFEARGNCLICWYWWHLRREVIACLVDIGGICGERWLLDLLILVAFEARGNCLICWYWWHLQREVIACLVDIGGIVDHHCAIFLLIIFSFSVDLMSERKWISFQTYKMCLFLKSKIKSYKSISDNVDLPYVLSYDGNKCN